MDTATPNVIEVTVGESGLGPLGQIVIAGRHVMGADEPEAAGGRDTGPGPYDYLAIALGSCTSMTVRLYAQRKALPLQRISVTVRHRKEAGEDGKPRDRFERLITLEGELNDEQRQRMLEIANRCPVHQTLTRGSVVDSSLT
jgi:putative redox protein